MRKLLSIALLGLGCCSADVVENNYSNNDQAALDDAGSEHREMANDEVLTKLASLGFDPAAVELDGNIIRVDGDVILYRDLLEQGAYAPLPEPMIDGLITKGYRTNAPIVSGSNLFETKLTWATGANAPSTTIKDAFINAAGDYNSIGSLVLLSQNNPGPAKIKVGVIKASDWPGTSACSSSSVGCAELPVSGRPGANIWMKSGDIIQGCDWTSSTLANRVRHELGHAYGLMHPKESGSIHIGPTTGPLSTATCSAAAKKCEQTPGYSTVMQKACVVTAKCTTKPTVLQTDDRASINYLY